MATDTLYFAALKAAIENAGGTVDGTIEQNLSALDEAYYTDLQGSGVGGASLLDGYIDVDTYNTHISNNNLKHAQYDLGFDALLGGELDGYATYSSGVDNRVAVFSSASNVEGDANFVWDGSSLSVNGNVLVGTTTSDVGDLLVQGTTAIQIENSHAATGSKTSGVVLTHYSTAQEPLGLIYAQSLVSANNISIGGGSALYNAATSIRLYTGANTTTTTGTARVSIDSSGDVAIGNTSASYRLDVYDVGATYAGRFYADGGSPSHRGLSIWAGQDTPSTNNYFIDFFDGNGTQEGGILSPTGGTPAFYTSSDERLKIDIAPTKLVGLDIINGIQLKEFKKVKTTVDGKDKAPRYTNIGYVAQQVKDVFPDMVSESPNPEDNGTLYVSDGKLVPVLVKAVQELYEEIRALKQEVKELKNG